MANETKKELSGFALWARKRAIKNAALKEAKDRYKQEELARKNKLKELKATDKEAYKEAVKKEKEESALRKLGLSASLKRAEKSALQQMKDEGLKLNKGEEYTHITPIKYDKKELKAMAKIEVEEKAAADLKHAKREAFIKAFDESKHYFRTLRRMPADQAKIQKSMDETFKAQDKILEENLQFLEQQQAKLSVYERKVELGLIGKDDRKYDQLKENVAFAKEKYDKTVVDMKTDLENMQEGLYRRDDVDKDFVDQIVSNRTNNISKQILGYPAIETSVIDRTDQLQLENRRVYYNTLEAVNKMSLEMTDAQKTEAITQKTDLMQKQQRQAELTRKEAVYKLKMPEKEAKELRKLESDVTLSQHISESIGGTYKVAPATKVELGAYFAKEKQQPVKETKEEQKVLEKQVEEKTKANDLEKE